MKSTNIRKKLFMIPVAINAITATWSGMKTPFCFGLGRTRKSFVLGAFSITVMMSVFAVSPSSVNAESDGVGVNLFILSGQSNMAGMKPEESFTPAVEKAFGKEHVIVVKDAHGGQPIRRWYKDWTSADGSRPAKTGDLYDRLMQKVKSEMKTGESTIVTVTFVWMQGERDANEKHGEIYKSSLSGLFEQLASDLGRKDLNFVVGRLSDFDMSNQKYPHWTLVREQQVALAEQTPNCVWVDTDDLNDGKNRGGKSIKNDLHYSANGYVILGQRFADEAIRMIESRKDQSVEKSVTP
ncbi:sialate O-acetylesterase [bacterium]|nr:sialate O-acetylesterase [bacterium]